MIAKYKAKLRMWLIDLVREAVRIEFVSREALDFKRGTQFDPEGRIDTSKYTAYPCRFPRITKASWDATDKTPHPTAVDLSFEQMQAEALQAQEKFYAPEPR